MTRAWSSSGSRTPAMTAAAVTSVIRRTTMTASLRAASTRCSTCRAGWRRLASSLPAISTPAADPHAGETLVAAEENRGATPRREAAHQTGLATRGVAAVRATSGSGKGATALLHRNGHLHSLACAAGLDGHGTSHASPKRKREESAFQPVRPPAFPCLRCGLGWTLPWMAFQRYYLSEIVRASGLRI